METGIQISSLKPLLTDAEQVRAAFARLAAIGCETVQLQWVDRSVSARDLAAALKERGLRSVSVQDVSDCVMADPNYYLELNARTGAQWLCVSRVPRPMQSPDGLERYVESLRDLMTLAARQGQRLCFHPVGTDYAPVGGLCPVELLLDRLPELQLCLDLYHLREAGYALPEWIRAHAGRIEMVHLKDGKGDRLVPAGQGEVPWDGAVAACLASGVSYAFVEQESWDRDPYACLDEALRWLRTEIRAARSGCREV